MKWFETLVKALFPSAALDGTEWKDAWDAQQRAAFVRIACVFFPSVALGYVSHFFFFDLALGLEPIEYWFAFRFGTAAICLGCFLLYLGPLRAVRYYKIPAAIVAIYLCYSQARVTVYYDVTYIFCFVFVLATVVMLRSTALKSLVFASFVIAIQTPSLLESGVPIQLIGSAAFVTLGIAVVSRTAYASEIQNFLLTQEKDQAKQTVLELTQEFSDRVRSFIPREIAQRLQTAVSQNRMSVLEATVEVLKPQKKEIACLFSDIRGFTQGSKSLDSFISNSVLPEIKACSDAIDSYHGIPRKIGDLVFAYFDDFNLPVNVLRAVGAGMTIARKNEDINATLSSQLVKRYILIAAGEAVVGNIGGTESSVEITALGSPVNYLSRLDDATKSDSLAKMLNPGDLIISPRAMECLTQLGLKLDVQEIKLESIFVSIKDFPEETTIFAVRPSDSNYQKTTEMYGYVSKQIAEYGQTWREREVWDDQEAAASTA